MMATMRPAIAPLPWAAELSLFEDSAALADPMTVSAESAPLSAVTSAVDAALLLPVLDAVVVPFSWKIPPITRLTTGEAELLGALLDVLRMSEVE